MTSREAIVRRGIARRHGVLLGYLMTQGVLVVLAVLAPQPVGGAVNVVIVLLGLVVLTVMTIRRRPAARAAWWLVIASAWILVAVALHVTAMYGLRPSATIGAWLPLGVAALTYPPLALGLARLGRRDRVHGSADGLDAAMTAVAIFLLLWVLVLGSTGPVGVAAAVTIAVFPIGSLVVGALVIRLILVGGLRQPSTATLLVAVVAQLATTAAVVGPVLGRPVLQSSPVSNALFLVYGVALGAAGLQLSAVPVRYRTDDSRGDPPRRRLLLFGVLALVPPAAWAVQIYRGREGLPAGAAPWVPLVVSALFLMLLVVRLGLIAQVAHRRAGELAYAVREQQQLQRQLTFRAWHDPLTGLLNRDVVAERLQALTGRADGTAYAMILLDLDGFKEVNDTVGHPFGDEVLVAVARRLVGAVPAGATLARLGGDEFVVLLDDVAEADAVSCAEDLLVRLRQPYDIGGRELFLTTSVGVLAAGGREESRSPSEAMRDADLALYAAKDAGKDRVTLFDAGLRDARADRARVSSGLRRALGRNEFILHYQPIVDLATGRPAAMEALVRWRRPGARLLPPAAFIPVAEDTGLITALGEWVLQQACWDARPWYREHGISVSVNVSGRQLAVPDFAETVLSVLARSGLDGDALILEITESSLVEPSLAEDVERHLNGLRAHGVRIAIDDFGTGYSSLSYVARLPVDIVKVDKSLVGPPQSERDTGRPGWAFTRAVLDLIASLELVAVVEGVETAEQADTLRTLGCPLAQGYHFSAGVPAGQIRARLAEPAWS